MSIRPSLIALAVLAGATNVSLGQRNLAMEQAMQLDHNFQHDPQFNQPVNQQNSAPREGSPPRLFAGLCTIFSSLIFGITMLVMAGKRSNRRLIEQTRRRDSRDDDDYDRPRRSRRRRRDDDDEEDDYDRRERARRLRHRDDDDLDGRRRWRRFQSRYDEDDDRDDDYRR
jgi:hypothetical protein